MLKLWLGLATLLSSATMAGAQPGTTVITHGHQLDAAFPDWPVTMGTAIASLGTPTGTVLVQAPSSGEWTTVFGSQDPAGEIILLFDWAESSAWLPGDDERIGTARAAADALYATMRDPQILGSLGGVSVLESAPGVTRPLHFIGHSRGTTVNSAAVRRLVLAGFTVDHVTSLDPHPIAPAVGLLDPDPIIWEGVTFADNYYRTDGCDLDYGCLAFDFDGQVVPGALNLDLGLDAFGFIDNRLSPCTLEHIQVHTWYHGTIDLIASTDGDCTINRANWYLNGGVGEGHFLSLVGGGAAQRPCGPTGGCADAGRVSPAPVPSIENGDFEYGAGHAAGWRWQGGGGSGALISEPGNVYLSLSSSGASRTHNHFFIDASATTLVYDLRVSGAAAGTSLEIVLSDPIAGLETTVDTVNLAATTGWETRSVSLAAIPAERTYLLRVQLSTSATSAVADLDEFALTTGPPLPLFRRGDCNQDQMENLADAIFALGALFGSGTPASCLSACDNNDDGGFDISDPITQLSTLFGGGPPIPPPNPDCGVDPTPDGLGCSVPPVCP